MDLKISRKLEQKTPVKSRNGGRGVDVGFMAKNIKRSLLEPDCEEPRFDLGWSYIGVFVFFALLFGLLIFQLSKLQIAMGEEMYAKSENNQVRIRKIPAYRGIIFDREGKKLVVNEAAMNVFISIEHYLDENGYIDAILVEEVSNTLGGILKGSWEDVSEDGELEYSSISEKIYSMYQGNEYFSEVLIASDIDDETAIKIKSSAEKLPGVYIDNGNKRTYTSPEVFSHVLGYTGTVFAEDLDRLDYIEPTDVIGRAGLEREYDRELIGEHGEMAWEVDSLGRTISTEGYVVKQPISGKSLYLTVDAELQKKIYSILEESTEEYGATGAAAVFQDPETGEIISIVSYPGYNTNLFSEGISSDAYSKLLADSSNPLLNRAVAAQMPPGSTFKPLVAVAGLDSGAITTNTIYVSRRGYTFSSGAPFQDYHNHAYGALNIVDAISVSSNIYFCELIRNWDMNELVPYLENFGIGQYTGIDIPGEAPGRLPSPENKVALAKTTSPWLDAVWYPEGDSCNSVIGQGITLVTPVQMANWVSAIANGGTLQTPHVADYFLNEDNERESVNFVPLKTDVASTESLKVVREAMWSAVNGSRATIGTLRGLDFEVAAKTGTAEFGALNEDGEYENTHAWVSGFFPYENPEYSFSVFLEDGGESLNAVKTVKKILEWMAVQDY